MCLSKQVKGFLSYFLASLYTVVHRPTQSCEAMFNLQLNEVSYYGCYLRKLHRTDLQGVSSRQENFADVKDFKTVYRNYVHRYERSAELSPYSSLTTFLWMQFCLQTEPNVHVSVDITLNLVFANFSSCLLVVFVVVVVPAQCLQFRHILTCCSLQNYVH